MIEVKAVEKAFGKVQAVSDATFTAHDGQITTILGANGSGKSTTMRAIAGLIEIDGGEARVDDIVVARDKIAARKRLGIFPDQFGLYPRLTAREEIRYFAGFHGLGGRRLRKALDVLVPLLGMEDIIDRRTTGFSQGQRMKVALARTLVHNPQNLMMDEPTRGLDVINIRLLRKILQERRDAGHCVLLTSHVMAEVHELSDRVVVINKGRVVADATPADLIATTGAASLEDAFVSLIQ
ncbi:MAG: ATP-binding cassette domain-containing protein [Pseudomonadota bacterium]